MKIALCGSTKFMQEFGDWNVHLTRAGHVVYSVCQSSHGGMVPDEDTKRRLDLVHLAKIDASDAIVVLNVGRYVGDSTRREIEWARQRGKHVYWLESDLGELDAQLMQHLYDGGAVGPAPRY